MILTLTLNPAVDQTLFIHGLKLGAVNRFRDSQLDPAGKGINVSRMAHRLGWPTLAFGFIGGEIGRLVGQALDKEGVQHHLVAIPGQTRLSTTVVDEATGTTTSFFGPGPVVNEQHHAQLDGLLQCWLQAGRVLVLAGRVPPGVPSDVYARYTRLARSYGAVTILDADGEPLRLGVEARPDVIKPNVAEAERLLGRCLPDQAAIVQGATDLARRGIGVVVISMGAQGAVCASGDRVWLAVPPAVERRSMVGPGDSMVAGLAVARARGADLAEALRWGTAAGAATVMRLGTSLGAAEDVASLLPQVEVQELGR